MAYRYFSEAEFRRALPSCSLLQMDAIFMDRLETARAFSQKPFIISSAYRSPEYEKEHGRTGSSTHCLGRAVDIRCCDSLTRLIIVKSLLRAGFRRIGIAKTYIHVDDDLTRERCIWLYD